MDIWHILNTLSYGLWLSVDLLLTHTPSFCPHSYCMPPYILLHISINRHFLNLPPRLIAEVIYGYLLRQMYFEDIKMFAKYCPKLHDLQPCNLEVCPPAPPSVTDSKYKTMDHQKGVQGCGRSGWSPKIIKIYMNEQTQGKYFFDMNSFKLLLSQQKMGAFLENKVFQKLKFSFQW